MGEGTKLITGLVGVIVGLLLGFGALTLVMQQTGGRLFESSGLGLLVSLGLVGGGGVLLGYLALWITGTIEQRRKKAKRAANKERRKKK